MTIYKQRYLKDHPRACGKGVVYDHVIVAEAVLGKYLPDGAQIHHVDGVKTNNAHSNLVICQDAAYHSLLHVRQRVLQAGGDPNAEKICATCQRVKPLNQFNKAKSNKSFGLQQACRSCSSRSLRVRRQRQRSIALEMART